MSARLDQPLDTIIDTRKKAQRDARRRTKPGKAAAVVAPVGGVKKMRKSNKPTVKLAQTGSAKPKGPQTSKIVVSGLPVDVNEAQIKEYFTKAVCPVKRVSMSYDREGRSQGKAELIFTRPEAAAEAAKTQNGIKVDNKPMRIDVVVDARDLPTPSAPKSLTERVSYAKKTNSKLAPLTRDSANAKAQPKSAVAKKAIDAKKGPKAKKPNRKANRPKPKTAEELDAEMTDYFAGGNAAAAATADATAANGTAAPATGDDLGMEEIS